MKKITRLTRKELIHQILLYSGDEFESKQDFIDLAMKTKKQLRKDLIYINNYSILKQL